MFISLTGMRRNEGHVYLIDLTRKYIDVNSVSIILESTDRNSKIQKKEKIIQHEI